MDPPNYYSPVPVYAGPMVMPHQLVNYIEVTQPHPQPMIPRQIVYIPPQIHHAGILPPSTLGLSLPARQSSTTADIGDVMSYLQPALQHLLRTNLPYIRRETRDRPLVHPTYAQKIQDIMQMVQAHRQPEGGLHPLAAGDEIMCRVDAVLQGTCAEWRNLLLRASSTSLEGATSMTPAVRGKRFLDLYLPAAGYFRENLKVVDFMLSSLNSQYVCTKDASQGGYTWMSKEEKRYVDRAMQVDNAARNAAKAKGEVVIEKSERSRRIDEVLCKWGYEPERGAGAKERANAILCAQAATQVDVVVPVLAAGMRRWRLELIEPLLAEPSIPKDLEGGADPGSPKETKSEEERGIFWDALDYLRSLQNDRQRQVLTAEIVLNFNHSGVSPFHKVVQDLETFLD